MSDGTKLFNYVRYSDSCPDGAINVDNDSKCKCAYKWYQKDMGNSKTIDICLKEDEPFQNGKIYVLKEGKCVSITDADVKYIF